MRVMMPMLNRTADLHHSRFKGQPTRHAALVGVHLHHALNTTRDLMSTMSHRRAGLAGSQSLHGYSELQAFVAIKQMPAHPKQFSTRTFNRPLSNGPTMLGADRRA
jgi:hypothetical protein